MEMKVEKSISSTSGHNPSFFGRGGGGWGRGQGAGGRGQVFLNPFHIRTSKTIIIVSNPKSVPNHISDPVDKTV